MSVLQVAKRFSASKEALRQPLKSVTAIRLVCQDFRLDLEVLVRRDASEGWGVRSGARGEWCLCGEVERCQWWVRSGGWWVLRAVVTSLIGIVFRPKTWMPLGFFRTSHSKRMALAPSNQLPISRAMSMSFEFIPTDCMTLDKSICKT